ncbi:MAG: hypothetical protein M9911_12585 [Saprospiraceae bacterium]|nr:hypothetical protein [Saprospiraceae bacterium]
MFYLGQKRGVVTFSVLDNDELVIRSVNGNLELYNILLQESFPIYGRDSESKTYHYKKWILISKRKEDRNPMSYDLIKYDISTYQSEVLLEDSFPLYIYSSKLLVKKYLESKTVVAQFDLELQVYEWELDFDFRPFCHVKGIVYGYMGRKHNTIVAVSRIDGLVIWNFDLNKLGSWIDYSGKEKNIEASRILGAHSNKLYIYLNNGKVLILDVEFGERINIFENSKHPKFDTFGNSIEIDIRSNKLIQLANQDLIEVDLESMEISMTEIKDMKSFGLENFSFVAFDSDYIFFTDKNHQTVGALNRATKKLDWTYKLSQEGISNSEQPRYGSELRLKGDRFYVLDNKNTLQIFGIVLDSVKETHST